MRKVRLGAEAHEVKFTTWTASEFYKMTKINLLSPVGITNVFKKFADNEDVLIDDFQVIAKLVYCAMASAVMPEDAGEDWKPTFTVKQVMNKIPMNSADVYQDIISAYFDRDYDLVLEKIQDEKALDIKNDLAPAEGQ